MLLLFIYIAFYCNFHAAFLCVLFIIADVSVYDAKLYIIHVISMQK